MPLTTLDSQIALIVIDLQKGVVRVPRAHPVEEIVAQAEKLATAFRERNLPVIIVNVDGVAQGRTEQPLRTEGFPPDFAEHIPELTPQPGDHVVTKQTWGAFTNTDLEDFLKGQGITQVVLVGIATSAGVESTARFAHELGFNVSFAIDAMTDMSVDAHTNSVTRIFPRIGETGTSAEVLELLDNASPRD